MAVSHLFLTVSKKNGSPAYLDLGFFSLFPQNIFVLLKRVFKSRPMQFHTCVTSASQRIYRLLELISAITSSRFTHCYPQLSSFFRLFRHVVDILLHSGLHCRIPAFWARRRYSCHMDWGLRKATLLTCWWTSSGIPQPPREGVWLYRNSLLVMFWE